MTIDNKRWAITAVIFNIILWASWFLEVRFWDDVNWLGVITLLYNFVVTYAAWMMILKGVQGILYFNRLFQWFNVKVHPMHPDEAGGLGPLGNYTLRGSVLIVAFGVGLAVITILVALAGDNPLTSPTIITGWMLYILLAPTILILPMLSAHRAMKDARNDKLNEIAQEFEQTLSDSSVTKTSDADDIKQVNEKLEALQTRYKLVADSFPIWPLPARLFRNFSITASLPLVSGLVSMAINFSTQ